MTERTHVGAPHTFTSFFPFCGLGAGARGFLQAFGRLGSDVARFVSLGGIDIDPLACADFEYLTDSPALCADANALSPDDLRSFVAKRATALGLSPETRPDCVFASPPCKGLSRLLSTATAKTDKYQRLNRLVLQGIFLVLETWNDDPPPTLVLENVPGIRSRGAHLLMEVKQLLRHYGYVWNEATHDCGEIGGLAQHRIRYLLVARQQRKVPAFIYRPPRLRVRGCGEVLESLPLPEDASAGPLHELPSLSPLNYLRLALIPAGGDWRDLPASIPEALLRSTGDNADHYKGRPGHMEVLAWDEPSRAVNGKATVSTGCGSTAVADPRIPEELRNPVPPGAQRRSVFGKYDIRRWTDPARTVAGSGTNGGYGVADPRLGHAPRPGTFGVAAWAHPLPTVRGVSTVRNGPVAVADPRLPENHNRHQAKFRVERWDDPAHAVTGARPVTSGGLAVADPRLGHRDSSRGGTLGVLRWDAPASTVTGAMEAARSNTPASVADPRVDGALALAAPGLEDLDPRFHCAPRCGMYGVLSWQEAAGTIIGSASIDTGTFAVADPRKPPRKSAARPLPIIIAEDGTWHRPLTRLELAALQGLPARVNGKPLMLATMKSIGRKGRAPSSTIERIGNAVPTPSARAIAESILTALLSAALGTWMLSSEGIWVRKDGVTENDANAPWLPLDIAHEEARFQAEKW